VVNSENVYIVGVVIDGTVQAFAKQVV